MTSALCDLAEAGRRIDRRDERVEETNERRQADTCRVGELDLERVPALRRGMNASPSRESARDEARKRMQTGKQMRERNNADLNEMEGIIHYLSICYTIWAISTFLNKCQ